MLAGDTLADKLAPPRESDAPVAGPLPDVPGRPPGLGLPARGTRVRARFPAENALYQPDARGRVLHFFANHELLALELMARTLLRFPEAPPAFCRGLVAVMADEQRHLAGYLARMATAGVRFGDIPVNRNFWDALAHVGLLEGLAGLSLTFEQANLDFAAHFAGAFRRVGDTETAAHLDGVLADEVRHVAHGVHWFDAWRPAGPTRWDAWVGALPHPLTPASARGTHFHRASREAAGLDAETITRVEVFGASRGRPQRVFSFHPEVEAEVCGLPASPVGLRVARDLACHLLLLARREDAVLVPRLPTPRFLADLVAAGVVLPELVEGGPEALRGRKLGSFHPWGWSPTVATTLAPLGAGARWDPRWRALYEKSWSAARLAERPDLCDPNVVGVVCRTWEEVHQVATPGHVLKSPLGTAGRGMRRWQGNATEAWARAVLAQQGALVVEPWLDRRVDLSMQFEVNADGSVRCDPWSRFLTDARGRYRGALFGGIEDLDTDVRRLLAIAHSRLEEMARHLGTAMAALGFRGPAGIDAMLYQDATGPALKPLVELNPRMTMGRVANALAKRVRAGRRARWIQVRLAEVRGAGFSGFTQWAEDLRARAPVITAGTPPQVLSGALFTSDPAVAERLVSVLLVGDIAPLGLP